MKTNNRSQNVLSKNSFEIPELPANEWKNAQDKHVKESLVPVTTWLCILFVLFSISNFFFLSPEIKVTMCIMSGVTALLLSGLLLFLRNHDLHLDMAHPIGAWLVCITLINSLVLIFLSKDISQSIYLVFILLGISLFIVNHRWFFLLVILTLIWWGFSITSIHSPEIPPSSILASIVSIGLAIVFHFEHTRSLKKQVNSEYQQRFQTLNLRDIVEEMKLDNERLILNNTALAAAANGIAITDRDSIFLWVNPAFTKITGYSSDEVIGKTPRILKSGLQDVTFYQNMWKTILDGKVWAGNIINRRKDGTLYNEEQTITPVTNEKGEITHFIGIKQDVTARVQAQEALERRNQELIQLNKAISMITSSLNLNEVEQNVVETVKNLIPHVYGATLQLMDEHGNPVTKTVSQDIPTLTPQILFRPGVGATGIAVQQRRVVNIGDVDNDSRFLKGKSPPPFKSLISIPIIYKERLFGALSVEGNITNAFNAQDERLLKLLANYTAAAIQNAQYSEHLEEMVEERTSELRSAQEKILAQQQVEREIRLAIDIQESLMPHHMPDLPGYSIAAIAIPAHSVSGDFYDFVNNDHGISLVLADIAGKGIPAAMLTSTARSLFRISSEHGQSPAMALDEVNSRLYDDLTRAGMFITMLVAQLNLSDGKIKYANAGHTEVVCYRHHDRCCQTIPVTGIPLGILKEFEISEIEIVTRPGDILLLYSDGITEATDLHDHLFGVERLQSILQQNLEQEPDFIMQKIVDAVDMFCQHMPHSDDITLIILKALPRHIPFVFPAHLDQLDSISSLIRRNADVFGSIFAYQLN